jgi:cytochrome c oxidase cbb3-type subunit I/II
MEDPRSTSPGSIMPPYPWLLTQELDTSVIGPRLHALRKTGVPYSDEDIDGAQSSIEQQAQTIVANLAVGAVPDVEPDREIVALIAYLQRLGKDIKLEPTNAPVVMK